MNYSIIKELGEGGMATVYLAEDKKFQTQVALKVLNKDLAHNENIRKRFLAEARNMYKMSHPNIIKVTDLIDEGDTVAFVMEHIDGETLKEFLDRKGKLTDDEIRSIFSQMLEAVGYVHKRGLVHRDIKPSNFMIDKEGTVKLLDFGIAKNTDSSSAEYTQTGTGMQMGTPMYMSPEQITETKSVTAQSDIYSLGVVLWQLVTGEKPYNGDTLSTFEIQLKIFQEPLLLTNSVWDTIIQKATEKNSSDRHTNTTAFLTAIPSNVEHSEKTVLNTFDEKTVVANQEKTLFVEKAEPKKEIHQTEKQSQKNLNKDKHVKIKESNNIVMIIVFSVIGIYLLTLIGYSIVNLSRPISKLGAWSESDKEDCKTFVYDKIGPTPADFDMEKCKLCICNELEATYESLSDVPESNLPIENCMNLQLVPNITTDTIENGMIDTVMKKEEPKKE